MMAANRTDVNALHDRLSQSIYRQITALGHDKRVRHATIDLDRFPIKVHGRQQGSSYNGHYGYSLCHPLAASISVADSYDCARNGNRLGNGFIDAILRQGFVHTAKRASRLVRTVVALANQMSYVTDFRMDSGYTIGGIVDEMKDQNLKFTGRLKGSSKLDDLAAPHTYLLLGVHPNRATITVLSLEDIKLMHGNIHSV